MKIILIKTNLIKLLISVKKSILFLLSHYSLKTTRPQVYSISLYRNIFHGYYDKSPFNPCDEDLVVLNANNRFPFLKPKHYSWVVLYRISSNSIVQVLDKTLAWNWQQGARLLWVDCNHVIYNVYSMANDKYFARKKNIKTMSFVDYQESVQDLCDKYFLSINYKTLSFVRPDYSYLPHHKLIKSDEDVYIKMIDFSSGKEEQLIGLKEIEDLLISRNVECNKINSFWINHVMISPNGDSFIYLVRYFFNNKKHHLLCLFHLTTKANNVLISDRIISHCNWIDSSNLIIYSMSNDFNGYSKIELNPKIKENRLIEYSDGHPTIINSNQFVTDTYPNEFNIQSLLLMNAYSKKIVTLANYKSPAIYVGISRCDLHPTINKSKSIVQIDIIYKGRRLVDFVTLEN